MFQSSDDTYSAKARPIETSTPHHTSTTHSAFLAYANAEYPLSLILPTLSSSSSSSSTFAMALYAKLKSRYYKMQSTIMRAAFKLFHKNLTADWHLYYYGGPNPAMPNFGDQLNIDLMRYMGCHYKAYNVCTKQPSAYASEIDLMCIGSILEDAVRDKRRLAKLWVFGSGFIAPETKKSATNRSAPIRVCALRGRLSQARMEKILGRSMQNVPLGDPGLLIRRMFPEVSCNPEYDVGIITHYVDDAFPLAEKIQLKTLSWKRISITQPTADFVAEVAQCRFILSSAMHGLICADSLGIPNRHILLSENVQGGDYKFRDYYSAYDNAEYTTVDLRQCVIGDEDIKQYIQEYAITQDEVNRICDRLEAAFPRWA